MQVEEQKTEKASAVEGLGKKLQEAEEYQQHLEQEHADGQVDIPLPGQLVTKSNGRVQILVLAEMFGVKNLISCSLLILQRLHDDLYETMTGTSAHGPGRGLKTFVTGEHLQATCMASRERVFH